jgi:hypothetical protein
MRCRICGREFDPRGFQVVLPGLGLGFDRVDCALEASAAGVPLVESPPPLPVAAPRPALALPAVAAPPTAAGAASARPPLLVGANLALLTAGTAATIYLWMRVLSPDAVTQPVPAERAAQAFARSSIPAVVDLATEPTAQPQPEAVVFRNGPGAPGASEAGSEAVAVSNTARATTRTASSPSKSKPATPKGGGGSGGPVVRPSPPPAPPPPPPEEPPAPPPRETPAPAPPVPTSPPGDRVPGAPLPGPGLPDSGPSDPGGGGRPGS